MERLQSQATHNISIHVCPRAARNEHVDALRWALSRYILKRDVRIWRSAARGGHTDIIEWAKTNGFGWTPDVCATAAKGGRLDVLRRAKAKGFTRGQVDRLAAARLGHLTVLEWLRANGDPMIGEGLCPPSSHGISAYSSIREWLVRERIATSG